MPDHKNPLGAPLPIMFIHVNEMKKKFNIDYKIAFYILHHLTCFIANQEIWGMLY